MKSMGRRNTQEEFAKGWRVKVLSRVMRKINSVTYEVGSAKAEQA